MRCVWRSSLAPPKNGEMDPCRDRIDGGGKGPMRGHEGEGEGARGVIRRPPQATVLCPSVRKDIWGLSSPPLQWMLTSCLAPGLLTPSWTSLLITIPLTLPRISAPPKRGTEATVLLPFESTQFRSCPTVSAFGDSVCSTAMTKQMRCLFRLVWAS